ncbi:Uncharacterized protein TCM_040918 [Theobroma cacao]|uniref:Uncharacterized protein n=1 Tax=Theobroma cacao TaxID=3641 RepID=A0A061GTR7_THECC|nr:Uncharacterized protein TCM_040918 [Theobroma cacao]
MENFMKSKGKENEKNEGVESFINVTFGSDEEEVEVLMVQEEKKKIQEIYELLILHVPNIFAQGKNGFQSLRSGDLKIIDSLMIVIKEMKNSKNLHELIGSTIKGDGLIFSYQVEKVNVNFINNKASHLCELGEKVELLAQVEYI